MFKLPLPFLNTKKIRLITILFCCGCISTGIAQKTVNLTEVLAATHRLEQIKGDSTKLSYLNDFNYNLPFIKSVQLRTETRDLLLERQEYTVRIKPNSLKAISSQKKMFENKIAEIEIENQLHFNSELKKQYFLLINHIFNKKLMNLYEEKNNQLKDKLMVLSNSIYDSNFDVRDLVSTEEELFDTKLKLTQLREENSNQQFVLKQLLRVSEDSVQLNHSNLILPQQILAFTMEDTLANVGLAVGLKELKLSTLENEMQLSLAKEKQFFDYVQAKYGGKNSFLFNENFSLGVGINLPFFGNTRGKRGAFYFNQQLEQYELTDSRREVQEEYILRRNAFKKASLKYEMLQQQIQESSISALLETYQKIDGVSPLLILKLKIQEHKKTIENLKSEHELYKSFIEVLSSSSVLYQRPLQNFLSTSLKQIN